MNKIEPAQINENYELSKTSQDGEIISSLIHKDKGEIVSFSEKHKYTLTPYDTGMLVTCFLEFHEITKRQMYSYFFYNNDGENIIDIADYQMFNHNGLCTTLHNDITVCEEGLFVKNKTLFTQDCGQSRSVSQDYNVAFNYSGEQIYEAVGDKITYKSAMAPEQ